MDSRRDDSLTYPSDAFLHALVAAALLLAIPHVTFAQCESFDSETTAMHLAPTVISTVGQDFTVCYDPAFADDLALFKEWVAKGMELGLQKYGFAGPVTRNGEPADVLIFLPPTPTARTSRGRIGFTTGSRYGAWRAELHYLTPSAWGSPPYGGLGYPSVEEYHAHYIVHETMHVVQFGLEDINEYDAQKWIWEALAEYDGYFHTTEWNRTEAIYRLFDRSEEKNLPAAIYCCRTLSGESPAMATTDVYYGGAIVMMFLAEHFGEEIHAGLFAAPMADLMPARGATVDEAFTRFQAWYTEKLDEIEEKRNVPASDYTPSMACTGRYSYSDSNGFSFEVRILNNDQRPAEHVVFQQQYRPDASHSWTTSSTSTVLLLNWSHSNFSTPLFSSLSSSPFQWRARSCPAHTRSDNRCSNWSNTIDWTAASCASRTGSGLGSTFTDHPLMAGSTPLRAIHFHELRQRIEVLRDRENLPPIRWTDPTLRAGATPVRRVHLTELRTALDAVYVAAGRARPSYTDAEVRAQATVIKAVHVMELREAVLALESARAPSLRHSTERVPTDPADWHRHPAAADVDPWAREGLNPPEELHDQGDLHQAPVPLQ